MAETLQSIPGIKRGDSLELTWALPIEFAGLIASIACQVNESSGTQVEDLTVTLIGDSDGKRVWRLSATASQTALWPLKSLKFDIKHVAIDGKIVHTETILLPVKKQETP